MDILTAFVIYLTLFRVGIIAAGAISIILGYRLFCKGIWPDVGSGKGTSVDAHFAGSRLKLKNAAPGTCFALFGVLIISIIFAKGGPELTLKNLKDAKNASISIGELKLRSDEISGLRASTLKGLHFEEQKDTANAIAAYEEAIQLMAEPMNNLAWLYKEQKRLKEALPLSRMAVQLSQKNTNYLDTLAEILFKTGEHSEALRLMEKAANLDPKYRKKLERFREATQ